MKKKKKSCDRIILNKTAVETITSVGFPKRGGHYLEPATHNTI